MKRKDVSSLPLIATTIILAPSTNVTKWKDVSSFPPIVMIRILAPMISATRVIVIILPWLAMTMMPAQRIHVIKTKEDVFMTLCYVMTIISAPLMHVAILLADVLSLMWIVRMVIGVLSITVIPFSDVLTTKLFGMLDDCFSYFMFLILF